MYHNLFNLSLKNGRLYSSQYFTYTNDATVTNLLHVSLLFIFVVCIFWVKFPEEKVFCKRANAQEVLCEVLPTFSPCGCAALPSRKGVVLSGGIEEAGW